MLPDDFPESSVNSLAEATVGFSGSDLKEMCRDASMMPLREYMRQRGGDHADMVKGMEEVRLWRSSIIILCQFLLS